MIKKDTVRIVNRDELTCEEVALLTLSLVEHMHMDSGFMSGVAEHYAETFDREGYDEWMGTGLD